MTPLDYFRYFFVPALILLGIIGWHRTKTLRCFSRIRSRSVSGGFEGAKKLLDSFHLFDIVIQRESRRSESFYKAGEKLLCLSAYDYDNPSITAIGRAQHEAGHVVQHMKGSSMLWVKALFYRPVQWCGTLALALVPASLIPTLHFLYPWSAYLFTVYLFFGFLLLPLELGASRQVYSKSIEAHIFDADELPLIRKVLEASALGILTALFDSLGTRWINHVP